MLWEDPTALRTPLDHPLERLRVPGTTAFGFTAFDAATDSRVAAKGWQGTIRPGDLFFLPGNALHHVRNGCAATVAINVRPWRHSVARVAAMLRGVEVPFSSRRFREARTEASWAVDSSADVEAKAAVWWSDWSNSVGRSPALRTAIQVA